MVIIRKIAIVKLLIILCSPLFAQVDSLDNFQPSILLLQSNSNNLNELLKEAIKKDSSNIRNYILLGSLYESKMQYDSAEVVYARAIMIDSTCTQCIQQMAGVMVSKGKIRNAVNLYNKVLAIDSLNTVARIQLARLLKRENRFAEALEQFKWLVEQDSMNFYLWEQVGDCGWKLKKMDDTFIGFFNSFKLNPANMPLATKIIQLCIQIKASEIGHQIANEAITYDSTYVPLLRQYGYLHFVEENYTEAERFFERAHSLGDTTRFTMKFYGISLFYKGSFTKSTACLEKAFAFDSTDRSLNFRYAQALIEIGERAKAIDILNLTEKLMIPNPFEMWFLYVTRADAYNRGQKYQLAIEQYYKAMDCDPTQTDLFFEIGLCHYNAQDYHKARTVFNQFIETATEQDTQVKKNRLGSAEMFLKRINEKLFFEEE
jgi:tetratricopeptide (TPR) repeat protein